MVVMVARRSMATILGLAPVLYFILLEGVASALPPPPPTVPEIDPGSMTSALTLLAGGTIVLAHYLRRKVKRK